jgi:carbon-monoxide dehydrogenase medium subunit
MIPAAFDYRAPASLEDAIALLEEHGDEAKILAGGHSLLPIMKLRLAAPAVLVDLARIPDLSYIRDQGDHIAIGAMTPYVHVLDSELLGRRIPLLPQVVSMVGDAQVRNRGTMGGAVAHADPAGDVPSAITALNGSVVIRSRSGERVVGVDDFFLDYFSSVLGPQDILTEIRIPVSDGAAQNYQKFRRRQIDWAIVGVAVNLTRSNGSIGSARVALTNVGSKAARATATEQALEGKPATAETVLAAAELADSGIDPAPEVYASTEYKKHLARVMTRRALTEALGL